MCLYVFGRVMSFFEGVLCHEADSMYSMLARFHADDSDCKVNLTVGSYADGEGRPYVLDVVRETEHKLALNHSYLGMAGDSEFVSLSLELLLGEANPVLGEDRIAAVQTLSGTGGLRILCAFFARYKPAVTVYIPDPSWNNHSKIVLDSALSQQKYRYWDSKEGRFDLDGMLQDLQIASDGSIVLLHACAHNPTGIDPTPSQWEKIADTMKQKHHLALFDCAYQGFARGDLDDDAFAVRYFVKQKIPVAVAQSFSKTFGLYGERVGCASIVCANATEAAACKSHLTAIVRPMYSSPPRFGAAVVKHILKDSKLKKQWISELKDMRQRIHDMRMCLKTNLDILNTPGDWSHLTRQIGMFFYSGLTQKQVEHMIQKHHIYLLLDGRMSLAGINKNNVQQVARAIHSTIKSNI